MEKHKKYNGIRTDSYHLTPVQRGGNIASYNFWPREVNPNLQLVRKLKKSKGPVKVVGTTGHVWFPGNMRVQDVTTKATLTILTVTIMGMSWWDKLKDLFS